MVSKKDRKKCNYKAVEMESDLDHSDYCPTQNDHKTSRAKSSRPNRLFKSNSTSGSGMQNSHTDETYEPIMGEGRQNNRRSRRQHSKPLTYHEDNSSDGDEGIGSAGRNEASKHESARSIGGNFSSRRKMAIFSDSSASPNYDGDTRDTVQNDSNEEECLNKGKGKSKHKQKSRGASSACVDELTPKRESTSNISQGVKIRQDRKKKLPYGYFDDDQGNAQGNSKYDRQEARFQDSYQDDYVTEDFDMEVPRRLKRRDSGDILRRSKRNKTQPQQPEQQQQEDTYDYAETSEMKEKVMEEENESSSRNPYHLRDRKQVKYPGDYDDDESISTRKSKKKNYRKHKDDENRKRILPINLTKEELEERGIECPKDYEMPKFDRSFKFDQIAGCEEQKKSIVQKFMFAKMYPDFMTLYNIKSARGFLFYGVPGCGKTVFAHATANECTIDGKRIPLFYMPGSEVLSKFIGEAENTMRAVFEMAAKHSPSIIFIDEIDGLAPKRTTNDSETSSCNNQIVTALLTLMDGITKYRDVLVIGSTNRPDAIDPALRRVGRFDQEFHFSLPDYTTRRRIFEIKTSKWKHQLVSAEDLDYLAEHTQGFGGADITGLCSEVPMVAVREKYPGILSSENKIPIKTECVKVKRRHWKKVLKAHRTSCQRASTAVGRPLNEIMEHLLAEQLSAVVQQLSYIFTPLRKSCKILKSQTSVNSEEETDLRNKLNQNGYTDSESSSD